MDYTSFIVMDTINRELAMDLLKQLLVTAFIRDTFDFGFNSSINNSLELSCRRLFSRAVASRT